LRRPESRLSSVAVRLIKSVVGIAVAALVLATVAAADGDPASDYLFQSNVFLPQPPPSKSASTALARAVAAAYARGYRVKVAVIASRNDLGAASSLFGQPGRYAQFLGTELSTFYAGPLLIVMPGGYGIYDAGRSTAAEEGVLRQLRDPGGTADALTVDATTAVQRMTAAGALRSKDIRPPLLFAGPSTGKRGAVAHLRFNVLDDSGKARETARVSTTSGKLLATRSTKLRPTDALRFESIPWRVPAKLAQRKLRFCVKAVDPTGNRSVPTCATLTIG
jgi:hypothetical protein